MQLLKYFFLVFITVLLLTASVTWFTNKGLSKSGVDFYGKINAAADTAANTNLILVGSSRTLKHLDPRIIDSITGFNSFNYGLNSGSIKTWYNLIKYAIRFQKKAKAVILNIDYGMFDVTKDPYKDAYYYPFEKRVPDLVMNDSGTNSLIHRANLFDITLYDDYAKYSAIDGWLRPGRVAPGVYKGYYPNRQLNYFENMPDSAISKKKIVFSEAGFQLLNNCIKLCKENNVIIVFVMAPYLQKYSPDKYFTNFNEIINTVDKIARQNDVPFYNFMAMNLINDPQYFYDVNHLNSKGASLYTAVVADSFYNYWSRLKK
jgi:hypothetical protein